MDKYLLEEKKEKVFSFISDKGYIPMKLKDIAGVLQVPRPERDALNEVLNVTVKNGVITLTKAFTHRTLEERAAEYNGNLNLEGEFDWGEPLGREVW